MARCKVLYFIIGDFIISRFLLDIGESRTQVPGQELILHDMVRHSGSLMSMSSVDV